jgi:cysteinyl-tRNA synthetase
VGYTFPPMDIRFYNTLTHQLEPFKPIDAPNVTMYNCGPTVYDYAHIGNFRAFVFADVLRRFLELTGHKVHQVMNITDVGHMTDDQLADGGGEDKMQAAAQRLKESKKQGVALVDNPDDPYAVAEFFTKAFIDDAKQLGLKIADEFPGNMPRATDHVEKSMIPMVRSLIEKDHAYVAKDGAVYFSVDSFPEYGKLSGNTLNNLRGGAGGRVQDSHQTHKRHPADFLLWKPDDSHLMKWDSPWGTGYPGWHIECSAMAQATLGRDVIDIHTGGEDNIFPHHECEIAQSCGATGEDHFARFWMHARFLMVEGEKMSKSKGNFYTVRDVLQGKATGRPVDPAVLRYELIKGHYRSNINFTAKGLADSAKAVQRYQDANAGISLVVSIQQKGKGRDQKLEQAILKATDHPTVVEFKECLADDLNVSGALGVLFSWLNEKPPATLESFGAIEQIDRVLGLGMGVERDGGGVNDVLSVERINRGDFVRSTVDPEIDHKCLAIDEARSAKDFDTADTIRQELIDMGYDVKTTPDGTIASKRLA